MAHRFLTSLLLVTACSSDGVGPPPKSPEPDEIPGAGASGRSEPGETGMPRGSRATPAPELGGGDSALPPGGPGVEAGDAIAFGTPVAATGTTGWAFVGQGGARLRVKAADATLVELWGPRRVASSWAGAGRVALAEGSAMLPAAGAYLLVSRGAEGAITLDCASAECRVECGPLDECPVGAWCHRVVCVRAPCPSFCDPGERRPRN